MRGRRRWGFGQRRCGFVRVAEQVGWEALRTRLVDLSVGILDDAEVPVSTIRPERLK